MAHIYNMQNMVSQEHVSVLPLPDGKLWWPCHYIITTTTTTPITIITDQSMRVIFTTAIPIEKNILKKESAKQENGKY